MSAHCSLELRWRLGYPNAFGVSCSGRSGGSVVMWKNDVLVDIKSYSKYHIDSWVSGMSVPTRSWRFTGLYADPARANR
jgi:hypothetical protein